MKHEAPKVSVLVPCFNQERWIYECLSSILQQQGCHYELIVSDDASIDRTFEIVRTVCEGNPRVTFYRQPNRLGMVENWNWCLERASGEYVQLLGGDDVLSDKMTLKVLSDALDEHRGCKLVFASRRLITDDSRALEIVGAAFSDGLISGVELIRKSIIFRQNIIGEPVAVLFRKHPIFRFNEAYRQMTDLEMWFRLVIDGDAFFFKNALVSFRVHSTQQTSINNRMSLGEIESHRLFSSLKYIRLFGKINSIRVKWLLSRELYELNRLIKRIGISEETQRLRRKISRLSGISFYALFYIFQKVRGLCKRLVKSTLKRLRYTAK